MPQGLLFFSEIIITQVLHSESSVAKQLNFALQEQWPIWHVGRPTKIAGH
jgi:hypothetical protein